MTCLCLGFLGTTLATAAPPTQPPVTKMMTQPAASTRHLAFVYADDLWVADADGGNPRRLTAHEGVESFPVFSPDGSTIAFTGQYDGNADVYLIPVTGGTPKRLTHHPAADLVRGFTPDGAGVLFASQRHVFTRRYHQFFTVPLAGGMPTQLPIPWGFKAAYSPDGKRIAYTPVREVFEQWKNYRGGTHSRIWIYTVANHAVEEIPQPAGRCNDADPQWLDENTVAFRSDRFGEFNLCSYRSGDKAVKQLTKFEDFPVLTMAVGGGKVVVEQAGVFHRVDVSLSDGVAKVTPIPIRLAGDLLESRARFAKGMDHIRSAHVSPSAARAVFEMRGEIVTVPAEKGDPRNLTQTPGANERSPAWSPDGKTIAYLSDASGEYRLCLAPQNGKGEVRTLALDGTGFYTNLVWSRDSKKLLYRDNGLSLYWLDVATGKCTKIATERSYGDVPELQPSCWSSDSEWVAFTLENAAQIQQVHVYSLAENKSFAATDGLSETSSPVFDANGKHLYFFGSTDSGMTKHGFAQSSQDVRTPRRSIYAAVLSKDVPSPFAKESDEEKGEDGKPADRKPEAGDKPGEKGKGDAPKPPAPTKIDREGLGQRIVAFPLAAGNYRNLQAGAAGEVYYMEADDSAGRRGGPPGAPPPGSKLHVYNVEKRKDDVKLPSVADYMLTPDGKKMLYASGKEWFIHGSGPSGGGPGAGPGPTAMGKPGDAGPGGDKKLKLDAVEIKIEPRAEWGQIYAEAWRINRDYFYAPNMHGCDWKAMRTKYEPFLEHAATRADVARIVQWMCSELAVGHHRGTNGERLHNPKNVPGGLLGADYEVVDGRYRFKTVYGGLNWTPDLRAPLTGPGVGVKAGEFLLAVQGKELKAPTELYSLFENTAGKAIEITVGPTADGQNSRTVTVEPIADEMDLRNRAWVEGNLKKVHDATGGKVAYVYVPDTGPQGLTYFKRYFFPQVDKQAIIVDERFNGGGQIADYYIDALRRPFTAHWAPRYGADWITPGAAVFGPKVMIIEENAGSGGDLLPWMFRKYKLGTLVGKRTWGGLVGISGFPTLMDGGQITAPNFAIWTEDGWVVENEGVPPDVEVEQTPAEVIAGRDPQLEKAIAIVLEELKKNPPQEPKRPPYPIRARTADGAPKAN